MRQASRCRSDGGASPFSLRSLPRVVFDRLSALRGGGRHHGHHELRLRDLFPGRHPALVRRVRRDATRPSVSTISVDDDHHGGGGTIHHPFLHSLAPRRAGRGVRCQSPTLAFRDGVTRVARRRVKRSAAAYGTGLCPSRREALCRTQHGTSRSRHRGQSPATISRPWPSVGPSVRDAAASLLRKGGRAVHHLSLSTSSDRGGWERRRLLLHTRR